MQELTNSELKQLANKAMQCLTNDQQEEAHHIANTVGRIETDNIEVLMHLGQMELSLGKTILAIEYYSKAVQLYPDNSDYNFALANALFNAGNYGEAEAMLRRAISLNPDSPSPYVKLGSYLYTIEAYPEAVEMLERAIRLKPSVAEPYYELVLSLRSLFRHDDALGYANKLVSLDPSAANYILLAGTLVEIGRQEEALKNIYKAIRVDKTYGLSYFNLANIKKYSMDDMDTIRKVEKVLKDNMTANNRSLVHFALGKMYDDCKQWDQAFSHFDNANLLRKSANEPDRSRKYFQRVKKYYSKKVLSGADGIGSDSEKPVFIVGMPRSGTTLLEQIIASHPLAAGAGELMEISRINNRIIPDGGISPGEFQSSVSKEMLSEHIDSYLHVLTSNRNDASRIVDKLPGNFLNIGLIHLLFPRARILHAVRSPLDICLSCYFQSFSGVEMSFDLDWIANQYVLYRKVMSYWKSVLPPGIIVDVHYENVLENTEPEIRRLIENCGLEWDPVCLEYNKSNRAIITASFWQARQSIYKSSRKRWHNYAQYLSGVASRIRDYLDPEDLEQFDKLGIKLKPVWKQKLFG